MRQALGEIVRHTNGLFDHIKVTGTAQETRIQAVDPTVTMFLQATTKAPIAEFEGEFGIGKLPLLNNLLNFANYKTDDSKFDVKREPKNGSDTVTAFKFRDAQGGSATFTTMPAALVGEQAVISDIAWDVELILSKAKVAEFTQIASIFGDVKNFTFHTEDRKLLATFGSETNMTNSANLVLATDIDADINGQMMFQTPHFLSLLKTIGSYTATLRITGRGVLGVTVQADHSNFDYYMRAK